jgi:hypothetical protein
LIFLRIEGAQDEEARFHAMAESYCCRCLDRVGACSLKYRAIFCGMRRICEARQVRAMCHHAVASQDLSAHERDAEFEKCASDSLSFLIWTVQGCAQLGLD